MKQTHSETSIVHGPPLYFPFRLLTIQQTSKSISMVQTSSLSSRYLFICLLASSPGCSTATQKSTSLSLTSLSFLHSFPKFQEGGHPLHAFVCLKFHDYMTTEIVSVTLGFAKLLFKNSSVNLYSQQQYIRIYFSTFSPVFVMFSLHFYQFDEYEMVTHFDFILNFSHFQ